MHEMADIKLYSINSGKATQQLPVSYKLEKEIQKLCEENCESFFGVRFLASEHGTGKKHRGRIDTLGLDENSCPVIIEYKLETNENVINQGLFYLDWLLDHKAEFQLLASKKNILRQGEEIDWSNPRLLCIAKDFTRYDNYAISQIDRNIELIRYRLFDNGQVIFEQAGAVQKESTVGSSGTGVQYTTISDTIKKAPKELLALYTELEEYIFSLGDDIQKKELKYYHAYSRIKNFVCVELRTKKKELHIFLKVDYNSIPTPGDNIRDVSSTGHYGTGDTEVIIRDSNALEA